MLTTRQVLDQIAQTGGLKPAWLERPFAPRLNQILRRLTSQGIISQSADGKLALTPAGKHKLISNQIKQLKPEHGEWDGLWRLVAFDIPEKHKVAREVLRGLLKQLGFAKLQDSLWLSPWPCRDQLDFVRTYYQIKPHVLYLETDEIENENRWRLRFKL